MKPLRHLAVCILVAVLSGCGAGDNRPDTAGDATSPGPSTTPAAASPSAASECGDAEPDSHERFATCLYTAFRVGDRELAARFATPEAVQKVFDLGGHPTDDDWTFEGCGAPRETSPTSGVSCHYLIPGEVHGVQVEMAMRADHVVELVQSIG